MENNTKRYHLDLDEALLAFSVLKKLGAGKVASFEDRLKSQKIQYLAQVFGVSPSYGYSLYLRGPYSSMLADDLFAMDRVKEKLDNSDFMPEKLQERFALLSDFVKGKNIRQLELVSTLHLFLHGLKLSKETAISKLKTLKQANETEVKYAIEEYKKIP